MQTALARLNELAATRTLSADEQNFRDRNQARLAEWKQKLTESAK